MKQAFLLTFLVCALALPVQGQVDPTQIKLVYELEGMNEARVEAGQVFSEVEGRTLRFDAYYPQADGGEEPREQRPAIVFVSGAEDVRAWEWFKGYGRLAAAQGFVGLVPDKRYSPKGKNPLITGHEDSERFLRYVAEHGEALGVDPNRLCLWTFSAGGRMAAVVLKRDAPTVRCLVAYYSILDASGLIDPKSPNRARLVARYSPIHALLDSQGAKPPTLVVRAGKDNEAINRSIDTFVQVGKEKKLPVRLFDYPEGSHGFDGVNNTDKSRAIIAATFRFVAEQLATDR